MNKFGAIIRKSREEKKLLLREVAAHLEIDQAVLSKIERGKRKAPEGLLQRLSLFLEIDYDALRIAWMADKVLYELAGEKFALETLQAAEEMIRYSKPGGQEKNAIIKNIKAVLKQFRQIKRGWLFGSFARNEATETSDTDVLIEVDESSTFTMYDLAELKEKLSATLNRKTDVVIERMLKAGIRENVTNDKVLIYEA
jgi:predicted nucleotidyltransferase